MHTRRRGSCGALRLHTPGICAGVLAACLAGMNAAAGVVIEQEQRVPGSETRVGHTVYYLDAGRLRIETQSEEGEAVILIFRAEGPVAWSIDPNERTYYELTPAKVAEMRRRLEEAQKEMAAQLAQLPPEQRQAIEQMMKGAMGAPAPATVRVVGRGEAVEQFVCIHYELLRAGQRESEIWTAPLEQVQLRPEEYETLAALARLFEPLGQHGAAGQPSGLLALEAAGQEIEGFPVRTLSYESGRAFAEERVVRAERQDFEANLFELPPGLRKTELGEEDWGP